MSLASTTDDTFEDDVLNAGKPVLVDYWAEWCPPCKAMLPALEEINREFDGKLTVIKLNIDSTPSPVRSTACAASRP